MSIRNKTGRSRKGEEAGAYFHKADDGRLALTFKIQNEEHHRLLKISQVKEFIGDMTNFFVKLDAVAVQIFDCQFPQFSSNRELCQAFETQIKSLNVPYCFITEEQAIAMTMLIGSKAEANIGEKIAFMYLHQQKLDIYVYCLKKDGYKKHNFYTIMLDKNEKAFEEVLERVQTNNPRYVLLSPSDIKNPLFISLSKLSFSNFGILYDDATLCKANLVDGISKWLLDKTSVKYYVHPTCARKHRVMNTACKELITVDLYNHLPLNKSCIIPKSVDLLFIQEIEQAIGKINHDCKKMEQKCHRNKITLSIDTNNFAKFASEPVILPHIQTLPLTLNETDESNIPVIGFCDNFSVICIHKDGGYKFVDGWNGLYGNELVINFRSEKPVFGEEALTFSLFAPSQTAYDFSGKNETVICYDQKKPMFGKSKNNPYRCSTEDDKMKQELGYVVYDLIKIMSMPVDDITIEDSWGFRITKDEDHPVLLEFQDHEKTLKSASPAFLMAILLKEHIKAIKNEIGKKPKKLSFCILDEKYSVEQKQRIKSGLEEACRLLKIAFSFINI